MPSSFRPLSQSTYLTSVDAIREQIELNHIVEQRLIDLHAPADLHERTQVQWFTAPASPNRIIGLLPAGLPSGVWRAEAGSPPDVYIATLLHRDRINIFDRILPSGLYDEFWLTRNDAGLLLGEGPLPDAQEPGCTTRRTAWCSRSSTTRAHGPPTTASATAASSRTICGCRSASRCCCC